MIVRIDDSNSKYYNLLSNLIIISNNPFIKYFVYLLNDNIVGFLSFEFIYDRFEIDDFFVFENYRNKGIGNLLLKTLIDYGYDYNIKNITLEVRKSNIIAINLYKKFGFKNKAIREKYYSGEDGILMEKEMIK